MRITAFATNTRTGGPGTQLAALELRYRRRARVEDRVRDRQGHGLPALPLHSFAADQIWFAIVALALDLTAWMQTLALTRHDARRWEPKRLRLRLFTVPAALARTGRRDLLHLAARAPGPTWSPPQCTGYAPWPLVLATRTEAILGRRVTPTGDDPLATASPPSKGTPARLGAHPGAIRHIAAHSVSA